MPSLNTVLMSGSIFCLVAIMLGMLKDAFWPAQWLKDKREAERLERARLREQAGDTETFYGQQPGRWGNALMLGCFVLLLWCVPAVFLPATLKNGFSSDSAFCLFLAVVAAGFSVFYVFAVRKDFSYCERRRSTGFALDEE